MSFYDIEIEAVNVPAREVDIRVTVMDEQVGPVPLDDTFAMLLLLEVTEFFAEDPQVVGSPMHRAPDLFERVVDDAAGLIEEVRYLREENHPPPKGDAWVDAPRARATLRVRTSHEGWLAHVRAGMAWSTSTLTEGPAEPWSGPPLVPRDPAPTTLSADATRGIAPVTVNARTTGMFRDAEVAIENAAVPNEPHHRYALGDDALQGDAITPEALQALLGVPVLMRVQGGAHVGCIIRVWPGLVRLYHENAGTCGFEGVPLHTIEAVGRARYVERAD
jgi:hypothetical protein